jgi:gas vesicle protein
MAESNKFLTGLIAGTVIGAVAGLLLAPKSGKETQKLLREQTSQLGEEAKASFSNIKEQASQLGEEAKASFSNIKEHASQLGEKAKASASSIFGKGQDWEEAETSAGNGSASRSD